LAFRVRIDHGWHDESSADDLGVTHADGRACPSAVSLWDHDSTAAHRWERGAAPRCKPIWFLERRGEYVADAAYGVVDHEIDSLGGDCRVTLADSHCRSSVWRKCNTYYVYNQAPTTLELYKPPQLSMIVGADTTIVSRITARGGSGE
jgi:hypothetical protein